jgi:hypothetical protein
MKRIPYHILLLLAFITHSFSIQGQITWSVNPVPAPFQSGGLMLLLSDGTMLCKSSDGKGDGFGNMWFKLTPDINGSYMNGSWSVVAPMNNSRLYFSSQLLKDGRVYVAGGEYGDGAGTAEIYNPVTNSWVNLPAGPNHYFSDANSAILDNGNILQSDLAGSGKQTYLYNPATNAYSAGPNCQGLHNETTWIKLPDNSILFVDLNSTLSERYIPALNQWVADAPVPVTLYDPFVSETGPAMLLPNGKVIFFGSTGNTAIYTPSGNNSPGTWAVGPSLPAGKGCPDTQAAMKVDGKIIFTASKAVVSTATAFDPPTYFYEYDYIANTYTALQAPGGGATVNDSAFNFNMLNLPDGTIALSQVNNKNFYFHKPTGAPLAAGVPTVNSVTQNGCSNSFTATGLLFNGISEGASFGDDWQMNTNFPLIRLQSGANVYYARTFNWNHTGVRTGALPDTTCFSLPPTLPNGTYSLYVVVNGIPSAPYPFTFNAFPVLTSPLTMPVLCSGTTFTYNATASPPGTSIQWTRAATGGILNPAVTTPQTTNPAETFTSNAGNPATAVYSYTLTNGSCQSYYAVNCVVSGGPVMTMTGGVLVCPGTLNTLTVSGAYSYTWSTGALTASVLVSPSVTTVYSVSGKDLFGCVSSVQKTLTVKPVPTFSITGNTTICNGDSTVLSITGNATIFNWNTGATTSTIQVKPASTTKYKVLCNLGGGCQKPDSVVVTVSSCLGLQQHFVVEKYKLYPNPVSQEITVELHANQMQNVRLTITDASGRLLKEEELSFDRDNTASKITLGELEKGIYFLNVTGKDGKTCYKVVKE